MRLLNPVRSHGDLTVFHHVEPVADVALVNHHLRWLEEQLGYAIPKRCLGPDVYGIWIVGET